MCLTNLSWKMHSSQVLLLLLLLSMLLTDMTNVTSEIEARFFTSPPDMNPVPINRLVLRRFYVIAIIHVHVSLRSADTSLVCVCPSSTDHSHNFSQGKKDDTNTMIWVVQKACERVKCLPSPWKNQTRLLFTSRTAKSSSKPCIKKGVSKTRTLLLLLNNYSYNNMHKCTTHSDTLTHMLPGHKSKSGSLSPSSSFGFSPFFHSLLISCLFSSFSDY